MSKPVPPCNDWKYNGSCRFGANCRYSHDIRPQQSAAPSGPSASGQDALSKACEEVCMFGECSRGDRCKKSHDDKVLRAACLQQWMYHYEMSGEQPPVTCKFYMEGNCMKGDKCSFWHPKWPWEEPYYEDEEEYYEEEGGQGEEFDEDEFLRDMEDFENEEEEREMYGGFTYEECMIQAQMQKEDEAKKSKGKGVDGAAEELAALSLGKDKGEAK